MNSTACALLKRVISGTGKELLVNSLIVLRVLATFFDIKNFTGPLVFFVGGRFSEK